jgi:hypothetical protein
MRFTNRSGALASLAVAVALSGGALACRQIQRVREDRFVTVGRESLQREGSLRVPIASRAATIALPAAPRMILTRTGVSFHNAVQMLTWNADARAAAVSSLGHGELAAYPIDRPSVIAATDGVPNPEQVRGGASGFVLVPLQSALEHAVQLSDAYHRRVSDEPAEELTVVVAAEEDVPFRLVYSALYTAGQARAQRFVFAVRDAATRDLRGFEYHLPTVGDRRVIELSREHAARVLVQSSAPVPVPTLRTVVRPSARMHVTTAGVTLLWAGYALAPDCVSLTERTTASITVPHTTNDADDTAIARCIDRALSEARRNPNEPPPNVMITGDPGVPFGAMLRAAMAATQSERDRARDSVGFTYVDFGLER